MWWSELLKGRRTSISASLYIPKYCQAKMLLFMFYAVGINMLFESLFYRGADEALINRGKRGLQYFDYSSNEVNTRDQ